MSRDQISSELQPWSDYEESVSWQALLIGNGASRAVWERFSYPSLFEIAQMQALSERLSAEDLDLFARLGDIRNFEFVLSALLTTQQVCEALDLQPRDRIVERYESIKRALIAAVHYVHVPWATVSRESLLRIREALLSYEYVYSTNYDLLVYWAIMVEDPGDFRDYFWGSVFDVSNTEIWGKSTKVLYLHGGLHLYYGEDGRTYKERTERFASLLDAFGRRPSTVPLCITEGSASQKLAAIARSDYLSFAFQQLGRGAGPLVLFGHALGETDQHIVDVLARRRGQTIALGIYPIDDQQVIREKARFIGLLPQARLMFFDSRTHPLGHAALRIK
jgi:hypothetical protein